MSENIRRALETALNGMSPALSTSWENRDFTPVSGTPYQRATMLPATPETEVLGCTRHREVGIFQVQLFYPTGPGNALAQARAEAVRTTFARGSIFTHSGTNTLIRGTPFKSPAFVDGDRYVVTVSIPYEAEIF